MSHPPFASPNFTARPSAPGKIPVLFLKTKQPAADSAIIAALWIFVSALAI